MQEHRELMELNEHLTDDEIVGYNELGLFG